MIHPMHSFPHSLIHSFIPLFTLLSRKRFLSSHDVWKGCFGVKSRDESRQFLLSSSAWGGLEGESQVTTFHFEGAMDALLLSPFYKIGALILGSRHGLHRQHWVMPKLAESPRVRIFLAVGEVSPEGGCKCQAVEALFGI